MYGPAVSLTSARERLLSLLERAGRSGPAGLVWGAAAVAAALVVVSLADPGGVRRWRSVRRDVERQQRANQLLAEQNSELQRTVDALGEEVDPAALERLAREQLGWVKPDEILFKFE